jgi:hypothetical protein
MLYLRVSQPATVHVGNLKAARAVWRQHGYPGSLLGSIVISHAPTAPQLRRLPDGLRACLKMEVAA